MAEVATLRAENQYQKQKRAHKKGFIRQDGSMTIQDGQARAQNRMVKEQLQDNDENLDPVLRAWPPKKARKIVGLRCSKCGSSKHSIRFCNS